MSACLSLKDHYCSASVELTFRSVLIQGRSRCESMCCYSRQLRLSSPVALLLRVPRVPAHRCQVTAQCWAVECWGHGHGGVMRIIFALMDANGDGKLTLEEFQAAHERIFKAIERPASAPQPWASLTQRGCV